MKMNDLGYPRTADNLELEFRVEMIRTLAGWRIALRYQDGSGFVSDQAFETREEAQTSFDAWVKESGGQVVRPN